MWFIKFYDDNKSFFFIIPIVSKETDQYVWIKVFSKAPCALKVIIEVNECLISLHNMNNVRITICKISNTISFWKKRGNYFQQQSLLCLVELEGSFYVVSYNFAPIFRKFDGLIMSTSPDSRYNTVVMQTFPFWLGNIS